MLFVVVLLLEILAGAEMDIFIPSFPELQQHFGVSPFIVELLLSVNFFAYCICSLIIGSLGDRFGRRKLILSGLSIFLIGSTFCVFASSFWGLLFGRFLQGIGIAGPAVLAYVVIADLYPPEKQRRMIGFLNAMITLAMAFAPVIGSIVSLYYSYQGNFVVLFGFAGLTFLVAMIWLPKDKKQESIDPVSTKSYLDLFKSSKAWYYLAAISLLITPYWIFIGIAPIFYMEDLGIPLKNFGFYQGAIIAALCVANLACSYLLSLLGERRYFFLGLALCILAAVMMVFGAWFKLQDPMLITLIIVIFSFGLVFPLNIIYPVSLEVVENTRGRMSAMIVALRLLMSAFGLQFVSYFYDRTFSTLAYVMVLCFVLALYPLFKLLRQKAVFSQNL